MDIPELDQMKAKLESLRATLDMAVTPIQPAGEREFNREHGDEAYKNCLKMIGEHPRSGLIQITVVRGKDGALCGTGIGLTNVMAEEALAVLELVKAQIIRDSFPT